MDDCWTVELNFCFGVCDVRFFKLGFGSHFLERKRLANPKDRVDHWGRGCLRGYCNILTRAFVFWAVFLEKWEVRLEFHFFSRTNLLQPNHKFIPSKDLTDSVKSHPKKMHWRILKATTIVDPPPTPIFPTNSLDRQLLVVISILSNSYSSFLIPYTDRPM